MGLLNIIIKEKNFFLLQILICIIAYFQYSELLFKIDAGLILIYCLIKGGQQTYIINPYYLFILTPITLLLYFNIGDAFFVDLTPDTWLLILLNINAILFSLIHTSPICVRERRLTKVHALKIYTYCGIIFTMLGIIPPMIFRFTGVIIPLAYIITMLGVGGVMCATATKKMPFIVCIIALYSLPILLGGVSKTTILTLLITLLISFEKFYLDRSNPMKLRKIRKQMLIGCCLAIPVMISAFTFANKDRGTMDADATLDYYGSRVDWDLNASYFMPYMYLETAWTNLQYVTETQDTRSYGYWLTKPILGPILGDTLENESFTPKAYSSFNTFSFIALHFKDFGYWGSILMSLFLGFFIKKVYSLFQQSKSPFDATSYVFTAQATLEMFFSNHFFGLSYPFMIVIVMYIVKKILRI